MAGRLTESSCELALLGLGMALPAQAIAQAQAAAMAVGLDGFSADQARRVPVLYRRTGVVRRGSVLLGPAPEGGVEQSFFPRAQGADDRGPGTAARMARYRAEALPLAAHACRQALAQSGLAPGAITHLVTVSCSGFDAPGVDVGLIGALGLPPTTERTHVGFMGCHGALNGLRVARALGAADPAARILLCAVELCSLHYQYGADSDQIVANALFADGAAALVGAPVRLDAISNEIDENERTAVVPWRCAGSGSCLLPDSTDAMRWSIGDHGFCMTLSPRVPDLIAAHLRPWLAGWLAGYGLKLSDIGSWAVHPGGPRILSAVEGALGLAPAALAHSRAVLAECGNMSSPTILFILERLTAAGAPRPAVALGFGPGLTAEASLLK